MDWIQSLDMNVQRINAAIAEARQVAMDDLYDNVVARARETPGWDMLADNISVWQRGGSVYVGLQSQLYQSQAEAAEYGDQEHSPSGMIRSLTYEAQSAAHAFDSHLRNRLPERML